MKELIERLEDARGPNFDLDREIMYAVHNTPMRHRSFGDMPPAYSSSLDAAVSIVPDGWFWEAGYSRNVPHNARVASTNGSGGFVAECDSNRAIALCIAALKARFANGN